MEVLKKRLFSFDLLLVCVVFIAGTATGAAYVLTWGSTALYYQYLFGPAAMYACSRGYVNPDLDHAPKLREFLDVIPEIKASRPPDVKSFSPSDLPEDVPTLPFNAIQRRELYLIYSVGLVWRIFGISWASVAVLQGLLYGLTCTAAYALFRLGMGRFASTLLALLFLSSPIHLEYLPALRDYSKAPFILAAAFLAGLVTRQPMTIKRLALLAAACGAIIGIGIGFRIDVIICLPVFLGCCLFLLPEGLRETIAQRATSAAVCTLMFALCSLPVLMQLGEGGNKGHPALLGFMKPYSHRLGVGGTPYELGHKYLDIEPLTIVNAFVRHETPDSPPVMYEAPPYEAAASRYTNLFIKTFPADVLIRAYAATLRVVDELRAGPDHAVPLGVKNGFLEAIFKARERVERLLLTRTRYVAILALLAMAGYRLRLGFAAFGMLMYFAGYSAVQFGARNCFHLQVIPLWVTGFVVSAAFAALVRWSRDALPIPTRQESVKVAGRIVLFAVCAIVLLAVPLSLARAYQQRTVSRLLHSYLDVVRESLPMDAQVSGDQAVRVSLPILSSCEARPDAPCFTNEIMLLEFSGADHDTPVTLKYTSDCFETDLTRTEVIPASDGITRLFTPVYRGSWTEYLPQWTRFEQIELAKTDMPRFSAVYRVRDPGALPLVMHVLYTPDWESRRLYQQLTR